jgi:hypothetical protein
MNPAQIKAIQDQWHDRVFGPKNQDWLEVNCFFRPAGRNALNTRPRGKERPLVEDTAARSGSCSQWKAPRSLL